MSLELLHDFFLHFLWRRLQYADKAFKFYLWLALKSFSIAAKVLRLVFTKTFGYRHFLRSHSKDPWLFRVLAYNSCINGIFSPWLVYYPVLEYLNFDFMEYSLINRWFDHTRRVYNDSSLMVLLYTVHETKFKDGKK